ncbi:MAG: hypothetical protein N3E51_03070 [Candidatus Micrarchaeota archaeon]|nr:hypothetical protein [Candidatus Micrarchaeota archaeon]
MIRCLPMAGPNFLVLPKNSKKTENPLQAVSDFFSQLAEEIKNMPGDPKTTLENVQKRLSDYAKQLSQNPEFRKDRETLKEALRLLFVAKHQFGEIAQSNAIDERFKVTIVCRILVKLSQKAETLAKKSEEEGKQPGLAVLQSNFNLLVDSFVEQIKAKGGVESPNLRQFVSDCLKAYFNGVASGKITTKRFIMVDADNNMFYAFDMENQELEYCTYAALGTGRLSCVPGSRGTPPGLSYLNGENPGSRGGFCLSGAESFNENNDARTIRLHDRNGPKGNLNGTQKTTWGCIGISEDILGKMLSSGREAGQPYYQAGVFVWSANTPDKYASAYVNDDFYSSDYASAYLGKNKAS